MTIKVLVVDDAAVVRRLIADVINSDPELEVVDTAANGRIALQKITELEPDIVTLDIEMPEMDGLETIAELRKTHPKLPVVMFSTLTDRGSVSTLEALARGATDYVTKPANVGSTTGAIEQVREQLIPKLKAFVSAKPTVPLHGALSNTPVSCTSLDEIRRHVRTDAIVIGSSTGGPTALELIFLSLREPLRVPIFVVQHIPEVFSRLLAERLDRNSVMQVVEVSEGMVAEPGYAYMARGGEHMDLSREAAGVTIHVHDGPHVNSCRPAVDILFQSAAEVYGANQLGVVLTGMGKDGLAGCEALGKAGAPILVQDEASSVVWGMPGFVAKAGLAHEVVPIEQIGTRITAWARNAAISVGAGAK